MLGAGLEPACLAAFPLKGNASANFATRAGGTGENRTPVCRFCRPTPYHLATVPLINTIIIRKQRFFNLRRVFRSAVYFKNNFGHRFYI